MENILYNISQVLGITIIHSLWQGLLIYFILKMILVFAGQVSASKKYLFAVAALAVLTGWFVYTLISEVQIYNWLATAPKTDILPLMLHIPSGIGQFSDQSIRYYYDIERYLPYITAVYIAGLVFNTFRLLAAQRLINNIKRTMSIDFVLQQQAKKFSALLNVTQTVKIGLSKMIDSPCMLGYFKPVILLPFTLSCYLSAQEIEAILLHELAHIKRNDYLVNLLQQVISILLFFNPCAQLINRIINEERENCCDDLVVKATADPIIYAKALLKLEQTRHNDWQLALAATGKKYHLLNRIERIMKTKKQNTSMRPALLAMFILTMSAAGIAMLNPQIAQGKISVKAISPAIKNLLQDTTRKATKPTAAKSAKPAKKVYKAYASAKTDRENYAEDKKLQELNAEIQKHAEAMSGYYNSAAFKTSQQQMEQMGKKMEEYYNRPEIKKQQEELEKLSMQYSKNWSDDSKLQSLSTDMGAAGTKIGAYYSSKAFKQMNEELEKKYGIKRDHKYYDDTKDENYKKYQAELDSKIPQDVKEQTKKLELMGEQMRSQTESPEFKAQNEHIKALADSISRVYAGPEMKQTQKQIEMMSRQMSAYQNSPQAKKERELMQKAIKKMTDYISSPEYKKHLKEMARSFKYDYKWDNEKPEKPEQPEKPEKEEQPENN